MCIMQRGDPGSSTIGAEDANQTKAGTELSRGRERRAADRGGVLPDRRPHGGGDRSGRGAITGVLAARAGRVVAVEVDRERAERLREQFDPKRVTILAQDVLRFDFAAAAAEAGERLRVVGNLPYSITSPILLKLAACHPALDLAVLMVQREVAGRGHRRSGVA